MEAIIYIAIFIIGTLFGSFFTLATYRIPLKQDITHKRSYCPNCNHRLEFWDMIPIFSYIFLKGKCRYCKQKIKPRYLLLEFFSGTTFLVFAISIKLNIFKLNVNTVVYLIYGLLYISTLFLVAGIEKQSGKIQKSVLIFGFVIQTIYIVYLYIFNFDIYKYVIYLTIALILLIIDVTICKKSEKQNYILSILALCFYMASTTNEKTVILSVMCTVLLEIITRTLIKTKKIKEQQKHISIGAYLCFANIVFFIIQNFISGVNI